ncbi:unnamed protein product, partial [Ceratitis capitata]
MLKDMFVNLSLSLALAYDIIETLYNTQVGIMAQSNVRNKHIVLVDLPSSSSLA